MNAPAPMAAAWEASVQEQLVEDVSGIIERTRFVEMAPARLFGVGLLSELADASDRLAAKVAKLQEAQGADR